MGPPLKSVKRRAPRLGSVPVAIAKRSRPTVLESHPFDYGRLPVLGPFQSGSSPLSFQVVRASGRHWLRMDEPFMGRVRVGAFSSYAEPPPGLERRVGFRMPAFGPDPPCVGSDAASAVTIEGFRLQSWKDDRIEYVVYDGAVQGPACTGRADRAARVSAPALVPSLLYGLRRCVSQCQSLTDPRRREELLLIGPPAKWVSSTVDPSTQTAERSGPMTFAVLPLAPGSSAALLMHVDWHELSYFAGLRGEVPEWLDARTIAAFGEIMQLSVEVVWPANSAPQALAQVSAVTPLVDRLLDLRSLERDHPPPP